MGEILVEEEFWSRLEQLIRQQHLVIDRPKGGSHPRYPTMLYPLDYGYLEGTTSSDGAEVDVWLGSEADHTLSGVLLSADLVKRDAEIKLLLGCTEQDIELITDFMRSASSGLLVVKRSVQGKDQI